MEIQLTLPNVTSTLQIIGCHIGDAEPNWSYPWHHHYLFELLYCREGNVKQTVGEDVLRLEAGDWLLIKSGISHATENDTHVKYHYFNLHFDIDHANIRGRLCKHNYLMIKQQEAIKLGLHTIYEQLEEDIHRTIFNSSKDYSILRVQSHILSIISSFIDVSESYHISQPIETITTLDATMGEAELAHAIEEKIRMDYTLKIADIASQLNISRGSCTTAFKKVFGQSPRQYVSRLVLNEAKHLLVDTTYTMDIIAERLGFQSASHFSRQFRRWTGMSPSTFRPKYIHTIEKD